MQEDPAKVTEYSNPKIFNPDLHPRNSKPQTFQPWTPHATPDSYGDEEFMVEKPKNEKWGKMSILM